MAAQKDREGFNMITKKLDRARKAVDEILRLVEDERFGVDVADRPRALSLIPDYRSAAEGIDWTPHPLRYAAEKIENVDHYLKLIFDNPGSFHRGRPGIREQLVTECIKVSGSISGAIERLERGERLDV